MTRPWVLPLLVVCMVAQLRAQLCIAPENEESLRQAHVDVIKRAILFKLQLTEEPENPSEPIVVPQAALEEYRAVSAAQELVNRQHVGCTQLQSESPPQFIVLQPEEVLRRSGYHGVFGDFPLSSTQAPNSPTHLLKFDLDLTDHTIILSTELRLWYNRLDKDTLRQPSDIQRISIYHVFKLESDTYYGEDPTHYCTRVQVSLEKDGYISFNVSKALKQWIDLMGEGAKGKFYLEVDVEDLQTVNNTTGKLVFTSPAVEISYIDMEGKYSKTTQLVTRAYSGDESRRKRRQAGWSMADLSCSAARTTKHCCRRDLVLDIHRDLNWTWVLRPRTLIANFCSGLCSLNWPTATYHTLLNLIYSSHSGNPTGSPAPCCVPDKFTTLPFLLFNRGSIELISIDDISIDSCVCR